MPALVPAPERRPTVRDHENDANALYASLVGQLATVREVDPDGARAIVDTMSVRQWAELCLSTAAASAENDDALVIAASVLRGVKRFRPTWHAVLAWQNL